MRFKQSRSRLSLCWLKYLIQLKNDQETKLVKIMRKSICKGLTECSHHKLSE